jgi:hypothetical protein
MSVINTITISISLYHCGVVFPSSLEIFHSSQWFIGDFSMGRLYFCENFTPDWSASEWRVHSHFFSGVCVARYLVFCVLFCRSMFVVLDFVLSLIYIFYLPLWYLPSFLMNIFYLPTVKSDINTRTSLIISILIAKCAKSVLNLLCK